MEKKAARWNDGECIIRKMCTANSSKRALVQPMQHAAEPHPGAGSLAGPICSPGMCAWSAWCARKKRVMRERERERERAGKRGKKTRKKKEKKRKK